MVSAKIFEFLVSTYGIQFFMQYLGGKALDKVSRIEKEELNNRELWYQTFNKTLELLCQKMNWEFDANAVKRELDSETIFIDDLNDTESANKFLLKLLGKDHTEYYGSGVADTWCQCIKECIKDPQFDEPFKEYILKKIEDIQFEQFCIQEELKKVKVSQVDIEKEWKKREDIKQEQEKVIDLEEALFDIEEGDYNQAIEKLKRVSVWSKDEKIKYICYYRIGYCYSQISYDVKGYQKSLTWFKKAEKICNTKEDDIVLLYRNIALLYILIGEQQSKIDNYMLSIDYFKKALIYVDENDSLYFYDILIHIARNYMDMCDEVSLDLVNRYLSIASVLMLSVCSSECELAEDQMFVLLHNLARVFYHKAEKNDNYSYFKMARDIYDIVLNMKYTKKHHHLLAMVNVNLGMTYQYDRGNKYNNTRMAMAYYELGENLYKEAGEKEYLREIRNVQLNIASAYKIIYEYSRDENDFKKSLSFLDEITENINYSPDNSIFIRTYLMKIYVYIIKRRIDGEFTDIIDIDQICSLLDRIFEQVQYEKYEYTYRLLKCELMLLEIGDTTPLDQIRKIKEEIMKIKGITSNGNANISGRAEQILNQYNNVFSLV